MDEVTGPSLIGSADDFRNKSTSSHGPISGLAGQAANSEGSGRGSSGRARALPGAFAALPIDVGAVDDGDSSDAESVDVTPSGVVTALRAAALELVNGAELQSETGLCVSHFAAELDAVAVGGTATVEALRAPAVPPTAAAAGQLVNGLPAPLFVWARRRVFLDVLEWAAWRLSDAAGYDVTADLGAVAGALSDAIAVGRSDSGTEQRAPPQQQQQL